MLDFFMEFIDHIDPLIPDLGNWWLLVAFIAGFFVSIWMGPHPHEERAKGYDEGYDQGYGEGLEDGEANAFDL